MQAFPYVGASSRPIEDRNRVAMMLVRLLMLSCKWCTSAEEPMPPALPPCPVKSMYVCVGVCVGVWVGWGGGYAYVCVRICVYVCKCVYVCVCMSVQVYMCV